MNIINLTPHAVRVFAMDGKTEIAVIKPSGTVARVAVDRRALAPIGDIPVSASSYGDVTGLPPSVDGTVYIVSALVRQAVPNRRDVYSPGELVRGMDGQPVGCKGLDGNL